MTATRTKEQLWAVYHSTVYCAATDLGEVAIRIGAHIPLLDALLARAEMTQWCFLTAWNPRSVEQPCEVNRASNRALLAELERLGGPVHPGVGRPTHGDWTPEESFLALGIGREQATALGRSYDQNAVVWGRAGQAAELLDCLDRA